MDFLKCLHLVQQVLLRLPFTILLINTKGTNTAPPEPTMIKDFQAKCRERRRDRNYTSASTWRTISWLHKSKKRNKNGISPRSWDNNKGNFPFQCLSHLGQILWHTCRLFLWTHLSRGVIYTNKGDNRGRNALSVVLEEIHSLKALSSGDEAEQVQTKTNTRGNPGLAEASNTVYAQIARCFLLLFPLSLGKLR